MKTLIIEFGEKKEIISKPVLNKLCWYDTVRQEMLEFEGTSLTFKYKLDPFLQELGYDNPYRLLPEPVILDSKCPQSCSRDKEFEGFLNRYNNYSDEEVLLISNDEVGAIVQVPDNILDDFVEEANRNNFIID